MRLALIGMAQNEFGAPRKGKVGVAVYNERDSLRAIRAAWEGGAQRVIVLFYAGVEYVPFPSPNQRTRCQFLVEAGADAVICQHSHMGGPIEDYKSGWSLLRPGRLSCDHRKPFGETIPTSILCYRNRLHDSCG